MMNHFKIVVSYRRPQATNPGPHRHFFTTEVRDEPDARIVAAALRERFRAEEGWKVSVTQWKAEGRDVSW